MAAYYNAEDNLEKLFLLEILVDKLKLDRQKVDLDQNESLNVKGTCVSFKFLEHPPLTVCEGDFCKEKKVSSNDELVFNSGKSCLFSLKSNSGQLSCFKVYFNVHQTKEDETKKFIGRGLIDLQEFLSLINLAINGCETGPVSNSVKDKYVLCNANDEPIGNINVYIRLSCFGKMIITQFHVSDLEREAFLFNSGGKKNVTGDVKGGGEGIEALSNTIEASPPRQAEKNQYQCPPLERSQYPCLQVPTDNSLSKFPLPNHEENFRYPYIHNPIPLGGLLGGYETYPPAFTGGHSASYGGPGNNLMGGLLSYNDGVPEIQKYQENGRYVDTPFCGRVRVGKAESSSESEEEFEEPPPLQPLNLCSCDYPLPPGFNQPQPANPKRKKKKKKKKTKCPFELGIYCLKPNCPMGFPLFQCQKPTKPPSNSWEPDTLALLDDRVIFQMPTSQSPQLQPFLDPMLTPYGPYGYPLQGAYPTIDPNDIYSLQVGRVMAGPDSQNAKVNIAFQSKKEAKKKPCRHHEGTQYQKEDFAGKEGGKAAKKGGKGGKDKGKGKGKGKKK